MYQVLVDYFKHKYTLEQVINYIINHAFYFLIAIFMIVFYGKIRDFLTDICKRFLKKIFPDPSVSSFFISISKLVINGVLVFIILRLFGVNLTGITAIISAISLVLGFAFKDTLSNFFGGIIILTFKPFKVNDIIDYSGYVGIVKKIEIFYTKIINFQNEVIIIPNGNIISNEIRNIYYNPVRRLDISVGVSYSSNIDQVKALILQIIEAKKDEYFDFEEREPLIGLAEMGASSLNFDVKVFIKEGQYTHAKYYLNETIKKEFDKAGIEIPFNQLDLHIRTDETRKDPFVITNTDTNTK